MQIPTLVVPIAMLALMAQVSPAAAQTIPDEYQPVVQTLGKPADFKDAVLKVSIPRDDLPMTVSGRALPTSFGFSGWVAFTKGEDDLVVMMGDLVLTEGEVNPVLSSLLENGLEATALHNHFFWEQPRVYFMHVHGRGQPLALARQLKPALDLIAGAPRNVQEPRPAAPRFEGALDTAALARIIGHDGERAGPVYKITVGRPDIALRDHGAAINARMGLNTWAAFAGTDADAAVAGDVAMLEHEVTPVLHALRANGLNVVAIHQHMTGVTPLVVFLHYYGTGDAPTLARGVRAALDVLGATPASHH